MSTEVERGRGLEREGIQTDRIKWNLSTAALYEEGAYDEEGNLLTTTMMTYLVPSAAELPSYETDRTETRADNPLGVKGVGETGTIASTAAVMNAVVDALSTRGITDVEMPATPERVWRAMKEVAS